MSLLKQLDRAARTAWCPTSRYRSLLASGTIAGTIDDSFETKSQLELYDIDLAGNSLDMKCIGAIASKDCFHSVAWGTKGIEDSSMPYGVVAGGMSDGSVNIWNVQSILSKDPNALLSRSELHKGQVLGLQFHPQQANLLASGATDGEVFVWDLANIKDPKATKPNPALKQAQLSAITALAWNKNAPQILASSSEVGETTVWDLRQKRSIITIRNSARMNVRSTCLAWNPAASVQLAVSYSNYPVAEVWDLRQSMTPKVKLEGFHAGSILSLDWCPHDPNILLTVGEDSRMASWNPLTGAFLCEYPTASPNFDIQWSPNVPNLISTCSYDGKVNIESINHTGAAHVPSWLQRPVGASFGFGGKLVSFGLDQEPAKPPTTGPPSPTHKQKHHQVNLQQLVTDPEVLDKAQGLQEILKQNDFPNFCAYKVSHSNNDDDKTTWTFMKILFEDEQNQRYLLLKELGFEPPPSSEIVMPQPSVPIVPAISEEEFFNQDFPNPSPVNDNGTFPDLNGFNDALNAEAKQNDTAPVDTTPFREDADDVAIRQALVFGDFKAAVARCLATNRMADAIIFASFGPPPLWEETRAAYFKQHKHPFIRNIMKCVSNQSLDEMVEQSELDNWKETLAILITYTTTTKYRELVNQLAFRLEQSGRSVAAVVCYICSSNIDKAIEMWCSRMPSHPTSSDSSPLLSLHAAVEKIAVFAHATNAHMTPQGPSKLLNLKYSEYASMLASQGNLMGAFNYLTRVATQNDLNSAILLDRLFHADPDRFVQEHYPLPPFPYQVENVQIDPTLNQQLAQKAHERALRQQELQQQQQAAQHLLAQRGASFGQQRQVISQQAYPAQTQQQPQHAYQQQQYPPQAAPQAHPQQAYGQSYPPQQQYPGQPQQQYPGQPQQQYPGQPQQAARPAGFAPAPAPAQPAPAPYAAAAPAHPYHPAPQSQPSYPGGGQPVQQGGFPGAAPAAQNPYAPNPYQPAAAAPQPVQQAAPQIFQPAPAQPAPFVPKPAAPAPAAAPAPFNPASRPPTTFTPSAAPAAAPAPAQPEPAAAPVVLSPADQALINVLEGCLNNLSGTGLKAPDQKKVVEIRQKFAQLSSKLAGNELSPTAQSELSQLVQAVSVSDFTTAQKHHLNLVKTDWANNNEWLLALKTMLLMAKKFIEKSG